MSPNGFMVNLDIAECNSFHENRTRIHHTQVDFYKFSKEFLYNEENVLSKRKQKVARIKIRLTLLHYVLLCDYISDSS